MRYNVLFLLSFLVSGWSLEAQAEDFFKWGLGATGVAGYQWKTTSDKAVLPSYSGERFGAGAMLDLRLIGLIGLEVGVVRSEDRGTAEIASFGASKVSLGQSSWHVPAVLKLLIPFPFVQPILLGGADFVFPGACTVRGGNEGASCQVDRYSSWLVGVGTEIKLPIPAVDIRIPLSLRYAFLRESVKSDNPAVPRGEWNSDLHLTAGASIYF